MTGWSTSETTLARKAWRHVARWFWRSMDDELRIVDLRGVPHPLLPPVGEIVVRPLTEADLALLPPGMAAEWRSRLPACHACVAWQEGQPVAWAWVTTQRRDREGDPPFLYEITPPPGAAYVFDVAVRKSTRGHGLGTRVVSQALALAAAEGAGSAMLTMDADNARMRHVTDRLRFTTFGVVTLRRLLGFARRDTSALRAWEQASAGPPSRPAPGLTGTAGPWQDPGGHASTPSPLGPPTVG